MTKEQIEASRRHFEIAGAVACSLCLGYALWLLRQPSVPPGGFYDHLYLLLYILLTSSCYLGVFFLLDRYCILPLQRFRPNWVLIALGGTWLSIIISIIPTIIFARGGGRDDALPPAVYGGIIAGAMCIFGIFMLGLMAVIWFIGFMIRLVRKEIGRNRVALD